MQLCNSLTNLYYLKIWAYYNIPWSSFLLHGLLKNMPQKVGLCNHTARPGSHTLSILKANFNEIFPPCEILRIIAMLKETVHTKITERKMQWERWLTLIQWFATTFGTSGILGGHKDWLYQSTVQLFMTKQDINWCLLILQPWSTIKLHILNIFNISLCDVILNICISFHQI